MSATTSGLARRAAGRRGRLYAYRRALLALFALGCTSGEAAELADGARGAAAKWHACQVAADCTWTLGEGGWPAAVSGSSVSAHQEWVESQAPFTTYFMPGDCFAHSEEEPSIHRDCCTAALNRTGVIRARP